MRQRASGMRSLLLACIGLVAFDCVQAAADQPPSDAPPTELLSEIIVTGTRLPVAQTEMAAPVTVLTRRDIERGGSDSLGKILGSLPMNTGSQLNTSTDGSLGAARVNLRGLGPERTLVLLNGRRFPNGGLGGDDSVDLNMLPVSLIDRVEVLPSGASAIHGADAVGGVVNVITRQWGAAIEASRTITERDDGQVLQGNAGFGFELFGASLSLAVDYAKQDGLTADQRSYSAQPLIIGDTDGTLVYAGQQGIPDGSFDVPAGNALGVEPGRYMRIPGTSGQAAADYRLFTRDDAFNQSQFNYSQMPNERGSLWLIGARPFSETSRFFVEAFVHERKSSVQGTPDQYITDADPSPTLSDGRRGIPADNYYNPFGVDILFAARRFVEQGIRRGAQDVDMWRVVAGMTGKIDSWNWELAIGSAESDTTNRSIGAFAQSRYVDALGPSGPDDAGRIVCGERDPGTGLVPAENVILDCVPLNLFGGAGSITQEQLDYMSPRTLVDRGTNDQDIAEAVLRGRWGQVLQRDVQWVFGTEYRREAGSHVQDPLRELGISGIANPALPRSEFDARELFAESYVPLLHDRAGARDTAFTASVRWSDFSSFGDHTSWQLGLVWRPLEELSLRTNFGTVFRAPSLFELLEPQTILPEFAFDPCGNDPTREQQLNCEANGVPGGSYVQSEDTFGVVRGGNPDLGPETGDSFGIGATYAPARVPGLTVDVDYFKIEIANRIAGTDIEALFFECADLGSPAACGAILRLPDGNPSLVAGLSRNQARYKTSGFDFSINWGMPTGLGEVEVGLLATYLEQWDEQPFPGGNFFQAAGLMVAGALPRWRASSHVDWRRGRWHASYAAQYIGSMTEEVFDFPPFGIDFEPYLRKVPSTLFHDLEAGYRLTKDLVLRAAITNATDEHPPFVNLFVPENTDAGTYPLLGRTYYFNFRYRIQD